MGEFHIEWRARAISQDRVITEASGGMSGFSVLVQEFPAESTRYLIVMRGNLWQQRRMTRPLHPFAQPEPKMKIVVAAELTPEEPIATLDVVLEGGQAMAYVVTNDEPNRTIVSVHPRHLS